VAVSLQPDLEQWRVTSETVLLDAQPPVDAPLRGTGPEHRCSSGNGDVTAVRTGPSMSA
jgi:hypothetical protein